MDQYSYTICVRHDSSELGTSLGRFWQACTRSVESIDIRTMDDTSLTDDRQPCNGLEPMYYLFGQYLDDYPYHHFCPNASLESLKHR